MKEERKGNESISSLIYRFNRKIQRSGIIKDARRIRFHERPPNKTKRKASALHRIEKAKEHERKKKLGLL